jgi:hypothetical protein
MIKEANFMLEKLNSVIGENEGVQKLYTFDTTPLRQKSLEVTP